MIRTIFRDIWSSRELLHQLVQRDLRLRYRQAVMGFGWAILMPLLTISAGLILRSFVARSGATEGVPSLGGIAIKSWAWAFFAGAMNFATMSLLTNVQLVTKIYFPREVLPLGSIAAQGVDSLLGLAVLLVAGHWLGFELTTRLLLLPVLILILVVLTTGLALLFACANLFFRDVKYILQVLLTFGIFFTPVVLEPSMASPTVARLLMLNPLGPILEGLRIVMTNTAPILSSSYASNGSVIWNPWYLVYSTVAAASLLFLGLVAFRRSATMFAEYY